MCSLIYRDLLFLEDRPSALSWYWNLAGNTWHMNIWCGKFALICTLGQILFSVLFFGVIVYFWFKYDLGQKYHAPQVRPNRGSNPWPPDHDSTCYVTEMPAVTTRPSVTSLMCSQANVNGNLYSFVSWRNPEGQLWRYSWGVLSVEVIRKVIKVTDYARWQGVNSSFSLPSQEWQELSWSVIDV